MARKWNVNLDDMQIKLAEARAAGHTRLFALAFDTESPAQWHSREDETAMQAFLDSRDRSESVLFNCAIAVVVVNPQDSDSTINAIITSGSRRHDTGPGFFDESF